MKVELGKAWDLIKTQIPFFLPLFGLVKLLTVSKVPVTELLTLNSKCGLNSSNPVGHLSLFREQMQIWKFLNSGLRSERFSEFG
jgi:hypothetical protein